VYNYNRGMRAFFDAGNRCGPVNYIDVYVGLTATWDCLIALTYVAPCCSCRYNMTASLAAGPHHGADKMTYDMVHWGIEANLHKAQIVLNALLSID